MDLDLIGEVEAGGAQQLRARVAHLHAVGFDGEIGVIAVDGGFGHFDIEGQNQRIFGFLLSYCEAG